MTIIHKIAGPSQSITVTATSVQSAAIVNTVAPDQGVMVKLHSTIDAFVEVGTNPVAIAEDGSSLGDSMFILADTDYYVRCNPSDQVAVIRGEASDGKMYITPLQA